MGQQGHVPGSFPEGGDVNGKDVQAIVQIGPKRLVTDRLLEVAVGRGDQTKIRSQGLAAAYPFEFAVLKDPQQSGLGFPGQVPDLVEKDGPAVGQFETADPPA